MVIKVNLPHKVNSLEVEYTNSVYLGAPAHSPSDAVKRRWRASKGVLAALQRLHPAQYGVRRR